MVFVGKAAYGILPGTRGVLTSQGDIVGIRFFDGRLRLALRKDIKLDETENVRRIMKHYE